MNACASKRISKLILLDMCQSIDHYSDSINAQEMFKETRTGARNEDSGTKKKAETLLQSKIALYQERVPAL